ncbi:MAG: CPBP family intramembrane glutamic endopeptidase [Rhodothermales bacterium]|nr:CPBP family intramembrane glutamic endopeptidase [Rhodothermales bacterium]
MHGRIREEMRRAAEALKGLDRQVLWILVLVPLLVIAQESIGSRVLFRRHLGELVPLEWRGLAAWGWWFGIQGILGFVIPVTILKGAFKRKAADMGLGLGDWKLALVLAAIYVPVVVVGTWFLSSSPEFRAKYPHYGPASFDWTVFIIYELLFLFYWVGWEYLWRGFMLFGTAHVFGLYSIFIQAIPFALLHLNKPLPEAVLSVIGGIALGALVWRCRSFWIAVPIHAVQMLILDLWCALRSRSGISGTSIDDLMQLLGIN